MVQSDKDEFMICASCQPQDAEETKKFKSLDLVTGHAYGVIKAIEI